MGFLIIFSRLICLFIFWIKITINSFFSHVETEALLHYMYSVLCGANLSHSKTQHGTGRVQVGTNHSLTVVNMSSIAMGKYMHYFCKSLSEL